MDQWLWAYLLTCAIEIPIVVAMILGWLPRTGPLHPRLSRDFGLHGASSNAKSRHNATTHTAGIPNPRRFSILELVALAWALQLTHPVLWLIDPPFPAPALLAEVVIVLVEGAAIYAWATIRAKATRGRATFEMSVLIAFCANAASLLAGLIRALV